LVMDASSAIWHRPNRLASSQLRHIEQRSPSPGSWASGKQRYARKRAL